MAKSIFFDTEFTSLDSDAPGLISIGLVAEDGQEFYRELLDTWDISDCSGFVRSVVLELLDNQEYIKEADLAVELRDWLESFEGEVVLRSDCVRLDWRFIDHLFTFYGCWPKNLRRKAGMIYFRHPRHQERYNDGLDQYWRENIERQHHALVDARSLRYAWRYAIRRGI